MCHIVGPSDQEAHWKYIAWITMKDQKGEYPKNSKTKVDELIPN